MNAKGIVLGFGSGLAKRGEVDENHGVIPNVSLTDPRLIEAEIDPSSLFGKGITEEELQEKLRVVRERKMKNANTEVNKTITTRKGRSK